MRKRQGWWRGRVGSFWSNTVICFFLFQI